MRFTHVSLQATASDSRLASAMRSLDFILANNPRGLDDHGMVRGNVPHIKSVIAACTVPVSAYATMGELESGFFKRVAVAYEPSQAIVQINYCDCIVAGK